MSVKTSEVTAFLKFSVGLAMNAFGVDDENYIIDSKGRRLLRGDPPHPVILYQEQIRDAEAHVLNPFSEGIVETLAGKWFYSVQNASLAGRVFELMQAVIQRAVDEHAQMGLSPAAKKKAGITPLGSFPPVLTNIVSAIVNDVDAKTLDELGVLAKHDNNPGTTNGLLYLLYSKKLLQTRLEIPIIQDGDDYEPPNGIRKGSLPMFRALLSAIFGLKSADDIAKFTAKADEDATPKVDSRMRCLYKVYRQINEALDAVDGDLAVDLSELKRHLDLMAEYSHNARSMVSISASIPKTTLPVQHMPGNSVPASAPASSYQSQPTVRVPGPQHVDGRRSADVEMGVPAYGYTGQPMPTQPTMGMPGMYPGTGYGAPAQPGYYPPQNQGMYYNQPPMNMGQINMGGMNSSAPPGVVLSTPSVGPTYTGASMYPVPRGPYMG